MIDLYGTSERMYVSFKLKVTLMNNSERIVCVYVLMSMYVCMYEL